MKRSKPACVCGHPWDRHEVGSGSCMKVDLNAGGRHIHRFCGCPKYRAAPSASEHGGGDKEGT